MFKLIIQDDEGKTTVVPLLRDEITIGRKEGNSIRLTERNVSRKHARIVKSNGSVVVEDLESYNGVKVNGTRIQGRVAVNESDRIQIGDYLLELKLDRGTQATEPSAAVTSPSQDGSQPPPGPAPNTYSPTPVMGPGGGANGATAASMRPTKQAPPVPASQYDSMPPAAPSQPPSHPSYPSPAPVGPQPGRLVVVSSNFGGREFVLAKSTMVIGRTDDNDIVINHRSISRHHAKVVFEQGRYSVVDMQSSNGVRVNGEEYGKVELRRADVIDLGHVRLRYVEPGEDFVFDRDAHIVDVAQKSGGKGVLWAALSVVVVLGAGVAFFMVKGSGEPAGAQASAPSQPAVAKSNPPPVDPKPAVAEPAVVASAAADAGSGGQVVAANDPAPAAAVAPKPVDPPPAPTPAETAAPLVAQAQKAAEARDWAAALAAADKAIAADSSNDDAKKLKDRAKVEQGNAAIFKRFTDARDGGRTTEALKAVGQLPKDSVYRADVEKDLPAIEDQFVKDRVAEAQKVVARGQCDKIPAMAKRAGEAVPEARSAIEKLAARCVERPSSPAVSSPGGEDPGTSSPAPASPPGGAGNADQLISEARDAVRAEHWSEARSKADAVLRSDPENVDALIVVGMAACNMSEKDRAQKVIAKLKGERRRMMKQVCAQHGLEID